MNPSVILSFALTGFIVSLFGEYTKQFLAKSAHRTLYFLGLSIVGGLVVYYWNLIPTDIVTTLIGIYAACNTAYVAFVQFLPNSTPTPPATQTTKPGVAVGAIAAGAGR